MKRLKLFSLFFAMTVLLIARNGDAVTLHLLPVGDAGNAVDPRPGAHLGAVSYRYYVDKYDVTNEQYVEFLNAKASIADPFGLYDSQMSDFDNGGISRSASVPYTFSVKPGMSMKPVVYVSWYDALRFANWLTNGQGVGDTEGGTYVIVDGGPNSGTAIVPTPAERAAWAGNSLHFMLPSSNEWYKAAFYKGGGQNAGYWNYPLSSNSPPISGPPGSALRANILDGGGNFAVPGPVQLTDVGAYLSTTPYGMFDMAGNAMQYTDSPGRFNTSLIDERGGAYSTDATSTSYLGGGASGPNDSYGHVGFRIAMVPEPGAVALAAVTVLGLLAARWRFGRARLAREV